MQGLVKEIDEEVHWRQRRKRIMLRESNSKEWYAILTHEEFNINQQSRVGNNSRISLPKLRHEDEIIAQEVLQFIKKEGLHAISLRSIQKHLYKTILQ